jgi:anti-sigma regulatory factor (Ser/Thr protein kinase)
VSQARLSSRSRPAASKSVGWAPDTVDGASTVLPSNANPELSVTIEREAADGQQASPGAESAWVGRLRQVLAEKLESWGLLALVDDARLLLSELLTNALCHVAGGDVVVRFVLTADGLRLEVNDGCPGRPTVRVVGPGDENGRGMLLVSTIAASWGVSEDETTTWCVLAFPVRESTPC